MASFPEYWTEPDPEGMEEISRQPLTGECTHKDEETQACVHWERNHPAFWGHCSHASCPNYMNVCPLHKEGL